MITAVTYARYSSDMQNEASIEAQQDAIQKYAQANGIQIVASYVDRALSAKTDDRPDFLRMLAEMRAIGPDFVLYHKFDRFARNKTDAAIYRREIKRAGARPIAVEQPLDPEARPEDIILESLLDGMAEYYSVNLGREITKGQNVNARHAKFNGGYVPFGLALDAERRYIINEEEAPAVRLAFEMAAQGQSYGQLCAALVSYRTRRGNQFTATALHEMLKNPKYCGIYIFNRAPRRVDGKRNWRQRRNWDNAITVEGMIPPIISRDLFYRVQAILIERSASVRPRDEGVKYVLTGKLYCGSCESPMTGYSQTREKGGKLYRYYFCQGRRRNKECSNHKWDKDELERHVMDSARHWFRQKGLPQIIYDTYLETVRDKKELTDPSEKRKRELDARIGNLLNLVEGGACIPKVVERLKALEEERRLMEMRLAIARAPLNVPPRDEIEQWVQDAIDRIGDSALAPVAVQTYIKKIVLQPAGQVEITFDFSNCAYKSGAEGGT